MFRRAIVCLSFAACGGGGGGAPTGIDISTIECPPDSPWTYENYGQLVMQDNCLSCHAGNESPQLTSVDQIRANKNAILREAVASTAMPEDTDMTLEERQTLGEWLACGAP